MKTRIFAVLLVCTIALTACGFPVRFTEVRGSGNIITETRTVAGFNAVELSGIGTLIVEQGEIEALQDGVRQTNRETLDSLHAEAVHMGNLVNDLHNLSLVESGSIQFKKEPLDLIKTVRACVQKYQSRFQESNISLADRLGDAEDIIISGDSDRLMQVFSNLLENTLRYTDAPGTLTVTLFRKNADAVVQFADTAPGVPQENLGRLFDRLYRVDPSRSRVQGGSGLGLAICKTIVEGHGGTISAQNAPSGGLQVTIVLPLQKQT